MPVYFVLPTLETAPAFKLFEGRELSFWQEGKVAAANAMIKKAIKVFFIKNNFCCKENCLKNYQFSFVIGLIGI